MAKKKKKTDWIDEAASFDQEKWDQLKLRHPLCRCQFSTITPQRVLAEMAMAYARTYN